jgi:hypothetical protein
LCVSCCCSCCSCELFVLLQCWRPSAQPVVK